MTSAEARKNAANRYNECLANRVQRWRRTRLLLMGALLVLAVAVYLATHSILFGLPFVAGAVIALFFWLDASDLLREVRQRNWQRLSPTRGSQGASASPARRSPGTAGQPTPV